MRKARNKKFSLLMALVFMFTVIFPVGAAFADDEATFSSSYSYISADKKQPAGTVTVKLDSAEIDDSVTEAVYVTVNLPDGVEFTNTPKTKGDLVKGDSNFAFDSASSKRIKVYTPYGGANTTVKFDFTGTTLDIAKDFTGNLNVDVDVVGVDSTGRISWTINDELTIAKVAEGGITIKAGTAKKVSAGGDKKVAKITIEESKSGVIKDNAKITLTIDTDDVEFSGPVEVKGEDGISLKSSTAALVAGKDNTVAVVEVNKGSLTFPGKITVDPILLDIAPKVDDDIEITVEVTNNGKDDEDETVTVASVGDVTVEVQDLEDNDTVAYAGQKTELDVEFTLAATDGSKFKDNEGDIITFALSQGEFAEDGVDTDGEGNIKFYDDNEAFYYTCDVDDDTDEIVFDSFEIILDNDAEPGDITLTIGGDYGDLEEIVIATTAKPYTVTADKPNLSNEALGQSAGDITITETEGGAIDEEELIKVELPSGVELTGKPKIDVEEGNGDAKILKYDDDYFVIEVTKESSSSKPSTFVVSNIKYDTSKLTVGGDVVLKFYGDSQDSDGGTDFGSDYDDFDDDSLMTTVANATIKDGSVVTATFKVGDEGVTIKNGRTLVQVNMLCDVLGLQKSWDEASKTAYFVKDGKVVAFPMGENAIYINGVKLPQDQGGVIINNFTYATLRGIQAAFGGELTWDDTTKTATFDF